MFRAASLNYDCLANNEPNYTDLTLSLMLNVSLKDCSSSTYNIGTFIGDLS